MTGKVQRPYLHSRIIKRRSALPGNILSLNRVLYGCTANRIRGRRTNYYDQVTVFVGINSSLALQGRGVFRAEYVKGAGAVWAYKVRCGTERHAYLGC